MGTGKYRNHHILNFTYLFPTSLRYEKSNVIYMVYIQVTSASIKCIRLATNIVYLIAGTL